MKPWQAAKLALEQGAPLDESENDTEDFLCSDSDGEIQVPPSFSKTPYKKLLHLDIPYTYHDEVAEFDGEVSSQEHRPNKRVDFTAEERIIALDEAIAWKIYQLDAEVLRLFLLRDIRNELYYFCDSEEA
jgi:hypothetical protein